MTTVTISLASSDHEKPCKNAVKCSQGWDIEINSLEDLSAISKETGRNLIISPDLDVGYMNLSPTSVITIYDTYVE
jgi:hypothetical protein